MPSKDPSKLKPASPIPLGLTDEYTSSSFGPSQKNSSRLIPILSSIQKYSSYTFTIFSFLHGTSVMIGPVISESIGNEMLSMSRTIYQGSGLENILVWGSLSLHVLSGITLRILRNRRYREKYGGSKALDNKLKRKRRNSQLDKDTISKSYDGEVSVNDDSEVGLMGGITNFFGFGFRKSYLFRKFGLSPLQATGYLSVPLVAYHALQTRIIPLLVEGDSSYISLDYISYIFNDVRHTSGPILNWIVYPSLIGFTTYHIISGWMKWLNVKSLTKRKIGAGLVNLISLIGIYSIYSLSKVDTNITVAKFVQKQFDLYIDRFYLKF